jgi:hypothetical protein
MLRIEIDEIDSMLNVLTSAVKSTEKSETITINWLSWDENIRMIIKFDSIIYLFIENLIDSIIDHFVDVLLEISIENDFSRFFLIQITNETW